LDVFSGLGGLEPATIGGLEPATIGGLGGLGRLEPAALAAGLGAGLAGAAEPDFGANPSRSLKYPYVKYIATANTSACVAATAIFEPPLGIRRSTPGVRATKSAATYRLVKILIYASIYKQILLIRQLFETQSSSTLQGFPVPALNPSTVDM
jgi:hypothetical protein